MPDLTYKRFIARVRQSNQATHITESGAQTEIEFAESWRAQEWYFEARADDLDAYTAKAVLTVYEPG